VETAACCQEDPEEDEYREDSDDDGDEEEEDEEDHPLPQRARGVRTWRRIPAEDSEQQEQDTSDSESQHGGTRSSHSAASSSRQLRRQAAAMQDDEDEDESSDGSEESEVHPSVTCDGCGRGPPLFGRVMKCVDCEDFDFCARCYASRYGHPPDHQFRLRQATGTRTRRSEALLHFLEDEMLQEALRRSTQDEQGPAQKEQAAAEQAAAILAKLSRVPWTPPPQGVSEEDGQQECALCLEEYTQGEEVVQLDCGHQFHEQCLGPWLRKSALCPMCRHDLSP